MERDAKNHVIYSQDLNEINRELNSVEIPDGTKYTATEILGSGTFGIVFKVNITGTDQIFAIKKVYQDRKYKNRELEILQELNHPNSLRLYNYFYTPCPKEKNEYFLNCVTEYLPEVLSKVIRKYAKSHEQMDIMYIKIFAFQMLKAVGYIHSIGTCHRDIKPQNILVDTKTLQLKLCDFGSAKKLKEGVQNIAYICSRYYRAPELIFGATEYTCQIDIWSIGCVIAELVLGRPIFQGDSSSDQLVEIIKILGTPSPTDVTEMNPNSKKEIKFPSIKPYPWAQVFKHRIVEDNFVDLVSKLLVYSPSKRLTAYKAMCHPFFEDLRKDKLKPFPKGEKLPEDLFIFNEDEYNSDPESIEILRSYA
ncbi:MAG: serine/threonine-protein kinase [archaeon]|nr:serine/threonine-protein kinase [archaeon]